VAKLGGISEMPLEYEAIGDAKRIIGINMKAKFISDVNIRFTKLTINRALVKHTLQFCVVGCDILSPLRKQNILSGVN